MKKFIVLDVEGLSNKRPYNVGYVVADKHNTIYEQRSITLPATFWENIVGNSCLAAIDMTHKNIQEMLNKFDETENPKYTYLTIKQFYEQLLNNVAKYHISTIWAYNVSFDKNALKRLNEKYFNQLNVEWADIWTAITYTKLCTKRYINWCRKNQKFTAGGNISTTAETVYNYLKGSTNFEEEHTGLADVQIELEILLTAIKSGKKIHKECSQPWRILNQLIKSKEW